MTEPNNDDGSTNGTATTNAVPQSITELAAEAENEQESAPVQAEPETLKSDPVTVSSAVATDYEQLLADLAQRGALTKLSESCKARIEALQKKKAEVEAELALKINAITEEINKLVKEQAAAETKLADLPSIVTSEDKKRRADKQKASYAAKSDAEKQLIAAKQAATRKANKAKKGQA